MSDNPIKPDPDRKPKRPRDANQLAKYIVDLATGEAKEQQVGGADKGSRGVAGGKGRAAKLTSKQKTEIAKKAAAKRWGTDS